MSRRSVPGGANSPAVSAMRMPRFGSWQTMNTVTTVTSIRATFTRIRQAAAPYSRWGLGSSVASGCPASGWGSRRRCSCVCSPSVRADVDDVGVQHAARAPARHSTRAERPEDLIPRAQTPFRPILTGRQEDQRRGIWSSRPSCRWESTRDSDAWRFSRCAAGRLPGRLSWQPDARRSEVDCRWPTPPSPLPLLPLHAADYATAPAHTPNAQITRVSNICISLYMVGQKVCHFTFVSIFTNNWPVFKILSLTQSADNLQ